MSNQLDSVFDGNQSTLTRRNADLVWNRLAERYAAEASGEVTLYVHEVMVTSVLLRYDIPALRRNPNVTSIRLVDPETNEARVLRRGEF